jgi:uncharacterized membrane protein
LAPITRVETASRVTRGNSTYARYGGQQKLLDIGADSRFPCGDSQWGANRARCTAGLSFAAQYFSANEAESLQILLPGKPASVELPNMGNTRSGLRRRGDRPRNEAAPRFTTQRTIQGDTMNEQTPSTATQSGLSDSAAGGLAYITIIPAIIFLIVEPYNRSSFVRFHAWQCIFLTIGCVVIDIALSILLRLPFLGLMALLIWPLFGLAFFIVWILALIKAFGGQRFKLPIIGDLAEKQANS